VDKNALGFEAKGRQRFKSGDAGQTYWYSTLAA
jgi:hypothetical protein